MSPLTKIFVVLLVVLSILFVSGTIVFVNRTEDYKASVNSLKATLSTASSDAKALNSELGEVRAQAATEVTGKEQQLATARTELQNAQATIGSLNADKAKAESELAQQVIANASATEALKLAQGQLGTQQGQLADLRTGTDKVEREYTDARLRISDLENKLQVTEKARRFLAEQNTQIASDLEKAQKTITDNGLRVGENRGINLEPQIALNGIIQAKQTIAGVPYATISIGSADQVSPKMQFKVIDSEKNQFLGYLTVDTVEPHEATGRLDGPRIGDIHKGNEVKTQL